MDDSDLVRHYELIRGRERDRWHLQIEAELWRRCHARQSINCGRVVYRWSKGDGSPVRHQMDKAPARQVIPFGPRVHRELPSRRGDFKLAQGE